MTDPQAEWTKTPPKEPGFYPVLWTEFMEQDVMKVYFHEGRRYWIASGDSGPWETLPEEFLLWSEPLRMPEPPKEDRLSRLSPEMRAAFEASWEQNREAYDYLAKNDGPPKDADRDHALQELSNLTQELGDCDEPPKETEDAR